MIGNIEIKIGVKGTGKQLVWLGKMKLLEKCGRNLERWSADKNFSKFSVRKL